KGMAPHGKIRSLVVRIRRKNQIVFAEGIQSCVQPIQHKHIVIHETEFIRSAKDIGAKLKGKRVALRNRNERVSSKARELLHGFVCRSHFSKWKQRRKDFSS